MSTAHNSLNEGSGYTLDGSLTHDLITSKVWLISELEKIKTNYSTIYILGSWYSNTSLYIKLASKIRAGKIINVDANRNFLTIGQKLLKFAGVDDNIQHMYKDVNTLNYKQLGTNGLIINTSVPEMYNNMWFDNIPSGTLVALQARDNTDDIEFHSTGDLLKRFPLKPIFKGSLSLEDPETEYTRFMVIGIKQ